MKIIEALKELPLIEKKIEKNNQLTKKYSSALVVGEIGQFDFETEEKQRVEVSALIQSTNDLLDRKAKIRRALAITNATVKVTINGVTRTITEWIEYRQKGIDAQIQAQMALDVFNGNQQLDLMQGRVDVGAGVKLVRFFDEKSKNDEVSKLQDLKAAIDPQLEMVNATTDLVEAV